MHLPGVDDLKWTPCSDVINYTVESSQTYTILPGLAKAGLKIFYYSGDVDAIVPITGTIWWFDKYRIDFGVAIKNHWRPWITPNKDQNISGMVWEL
jgi:serine carboxypeptidase-like clade 2